MRKVKKETMKKLEKERYKAKARVFKALAHPSRLVMVQALKKGEKCVCELFELIDADRSTVSKHLAVLRNAGIVEDDKRGLKVFYRLRCPCVLTFITCVEEVIQKDYETIRRVANG